jgi:imidazolonepropionase-like amidohydrolase
MATTYLAARIFDGDETTIEDGFITIDNGTISAIGKKSDLGSAASDAVDLGDATILPGLINMHTHMTFSADHDVLGNALNDSHETKLVRAIENLRKSIRSGVTTVRDCGAPNEVAFALRTASENNLIEAPHVWAAGQVLTSTGGHCYYIGVEVDSVTDIKRAVRNQVKAGADFIKVMATGGGLTPNSYPENAQFSEIELVALADDSRRLNRKIAAHCHGTPGIRNAIAAEVTTIEHCSFMTPNGVEYEEDAAEQVAEKGIYVCPTLSTGERARQAAMAQGIELPARWAGMRERRTDNLRRMTDLGVQFVSGNDAGVTLTGFDDFQLDLEMLVEYIGYTNEKAIATATSVAAKAIGTEEYGTLAEGKRADILAVNGNALHDIGALRDIQFVMKSGEVVVDYR